MSTACPRVQTRAATEGHERSSADVIGLVPSSAAQRPATARKVDSCRSIRDVNVALIEAFVRGDQFWGVAKAIEPAVGLRQVVRVRSSAEAESVVAR